MRCFAARTVNSLPVLKEVCLAHALAAADKRDTLEPEGGFALGCVHDAASHDGIVNAVYADEVFVIIELDETVNVIRPDLVEGFKNIVVGRINAPTCFDKLVARLLENICKIFVYAESKNLILVCTEIASLELFSRFVILFV